MAFLKTDNLIWTQHGLQKLKQYRLSAGRVLRVLRHPKRREIGVAERTVACMQSAGTAKHPYEIWVMYQLRRKAEQIPISKSQFPNKNNEIIIISAWRYPGVSSINAPPPIPDEVWEEIKKSG